MFKKAFFKVLLCAIISAVLSCLFQYGQDKVIDYNLVISIEVALFSVSLAIIALLITILDKYKEKTADQETWAVHSAAILKEICDNTIALLVIVILLFAASIFKPVIVLIPHLDAMTTILLFSIIISLFAMFDTTIGVCHLVVNLKNLLVGSDSKDLKLTQREIYLIEAYRFLDNERKKSLDDCLKGLATTQQVDAAGKNEKK